MGIYGGVEKRITFSDRRVRTDRRLGPEERRQEQDPQWQGVKDQRTGLLCRRLAPVDRRENVDDRRQL